MTQFEMIFYAAFTAIGVYASAYYLWCVIWDALEILVRKTQAKRREDEGYKIDEEAS